MSKSDLMKSVPRNGKIIGMRYGFWTVIRKLPPEGKVSRFECRCECGTIKPVYATNLYRHKSLSCGCYRSTVHSHRADLTGKRFRRLLVLKRIGLKPNTKRHSPLYECRCDCGSVIDVTSNSLLQGSRVSCGCARNKTSIKQRGQRKAYTNYRKQAAIRKLSFDISLKKFIELSQQPCAYCGDLRTNSAKFERVIGGGEYKYNGLDRLDSTKGYSIDNVVPCCKICNFAKSTTGHQEFLSWVKKVFNYTNGGLPNEHRQEFNLRKVI